MIADISEENARLVALEIGMSNCMYAVVDVTDEEKVRDSILQISNKYGFINCAVNCAGISPPMRTLNKKGIPHDLAIFRSSSSSISSL